ncbi:MAG: fasciclin domain-containing protein [Thermoflavifilum sp.]|nr:fasciclin domain-containing protein [Thermoflavifilum sp.]
MLFLGAFHMSKAQSSTEKTVLVGGAPMYPSKNIIENALNSKDHTTLVAAVKAAGLVETLEGPGPFTVFAPTNEAFDMLPKGTVENLLKPENKAQLTSILTYHVVPGKYDQKSLLELIKAQHGTAKLKTVEGQELSFERKGKTVWVIDDQGHKAMITIPDVYQSNGVIHVINRVLQP